MREIGFVTFQQLGMVERLGGAPKQTVDALLAEAKKRNPDALLVTLRRADDRSGFAILAL